MTDNGRPDVSIVIPCYNQAHYLGECLGSIRAQTYPHWQVVVVDDASPDYEQICSVVEALEDSRIRVVRHEENRGLAAARNTGIRESESDIFLAVDADDKLEPSCLEALVPLIRSDETLDCVFPDVRLFGRRKGILKFPGPAPGKKVLRPEDTLPGAGTLMRKRFWKRVGCYDESEILRSGREDFEFYVRAFSNGCKAKHVAEPLYLYRICHASMAITCRREDHQIASYIYKKHRRLFDAAGEGRRLLAEGFRNAAWAAYHRGEQLRALRLGLQTWRARPTRKQLRSVGGVILPRSWARAVERGEVRRHTPFLGYPVKGKARYQPFFIIGVARSGNTLFRRILTSHSQLHLPPETFVLGACIRKFRRYGKRMSWPDLVHFIMAQFEFHAEFHTFRISLAPLVNNLVNVPRRNRNLAFLFNSFYRFHARQQGKTSVRWGDKTPLNSLDDHLVRGDTPPRLGHGVPHTLERLLKVFPDAQFLHIYRDGCDVVHSHLRGGFMSDLDEAASRWLHVIRQTRRFVRRHSKQALEIRYEDLVSRPEYALRAVCDFLNVAFEPSMLASEKNGALLGDVPAWFWHEQVNAPINAGNPGKGRRYFSEKDKAQLQGLIGAELETLGYPPCTVEPDAMASGTLVTRS